jgi:hypothetical protein
MTSTTLTKEMQMKHMKYDDFYRLALFDITFCVIDKDGNELKDKDGNAIVYYNKNANYDNLVDNALGDSGIADVVCEHNGWRKTKNPFKN